MLLLLFLQLLIIFYAGDVDVVVAAVNSFDAGVVDVVVAVVVAVDSVYAGVVDVHC